MSEINTFIKRMLLVVLFLGISIFTYAQEGVVPGKIRVKLAESSRNDISSKQLVQYGAVTTGIRPFDAVAATYGAVDMKRVFRHAGKHEAKHMKYGLDLWYEITINNNADLYSAVNDFKNLPQVVKAESIRIKSLGNAKPTLFTASSKKDNLAPVNDPMLSSQWHYNNDAIESWQVAGSDINLFEAWEITKGSPNVIVSIVDGGIDIEHEDLNANLWVNEAENSGDNNQDNDNNGYAGDVNGFNFVTGSSVVTPHSHGTHVAGTVSAVSNNDIGVAGVAGGTGNNDGVRIMSCQVFDEVAGAGGFAEAIVYGADNGAVISQNSWGYRVPGNPEQVILDAIDYFIAEAGNYPGSPMKGGVVFFAAGNDNYDAEWYPGYYESAISVSSLGPDSKKASYSNFGAWVDIASYGGEQAFSMSAGVLSTLPGNKYGYFHGTSMACPHISGIAALVVSKHGSSEFTKDDLINRMMTGIRDVYEFNEGYIGKLGVGISDAASALAINNGIAPNKIDSFVLNGISQDFATLKWNVPSTGNKGGTPVKYIIYYSEKELNNSNLDQALKAEVKGNMFHEVGQELTYQIDGLKPTTKYYFAIVGLDRWSNQSELSDVVSGTTNDGPLAGIETEKVNLNLNVSNSSIATSTMEISNNKDGVLTWEIETRDIRHNLAWNSVSRPTIVKNITMSDVKIGQQTLKKVETVSAPSTYSSFKRIVETAGNLQMVIGMEDSLVTNSSAVKFTVNNEKGFNLTDVSAFLNLDREDGPFTVEIYSEDLDPKNLLVATTGSVYSDFSMSYETKLPEQIFFEQGESFWVVHHAPSGNVFPLGVGVALENHYATNSYMSFDLGKTWVKLFDVFPKENMAWTVSAISNNETLGKYIELSPDQGTINGKGKQEITMSFDGSKLINGTYSSNAILSSNDLENQNLRMPITFKVEGHKPKIESASIVRFGSIFTGTSKELEIELKNTGFGNLTGVKVSVDNSDFEIAYKPYKVSARSTDKIRVKFSPSKVGSINGIVTIEDSKGYSYKINIHGVGEAPAEISLDKEEITFNDVAIGGDDLHGTFKITNTGKFPLSYAIPAFTDNLGELEGQIDGVSKFGYQYTVNRNINEFNWVDISATGTDITNYFKQSHQNNYYKVSIGFDLYYFGEVVSDLFITNYGLLSVKDDSSFNGSPEFLSESNPSGMISAIFKDINLIEGGSITYKKSPGMLIVQYTDVVINSGNTMTFQIIINDNGNIDFKYKNNKVSWGEPFQYIHVGIENSSRTEGLLIQDIFEDVNANIVDGTTISIKSPGLGIISSVTNPVGMINVGDSVEIDAVISTADIPEGNYEEFLTILSNDPNNNPKLMKFNVNINSGGVAKLELSKDSQEYGEVFQNSVRDGMIIIKNSGTRSVEIKDVRSVEGDVIIKDFESVVLKPKQSISIAYSLKTDKVKAINDKIEITQTQGDKIEIPVTANIVEGPSILFNKEEYVATLEYGKSETQKMTITNDGPKELEMTIMGNEWLSISENVGANPTSSDLEDFSYSWRTNKQVNGPEFIWEYLDNPTEIEFNPENGFSNLVDLPFTLKYFNEDYDKIYIGINGIISLVDMPYFYLFPMELGEIEPNNIIAPFWAAHGPNYRDDNAGIFYQVFEDKIIVSYLKFIDPFGMGDTYDFQAIIHNDGVIKFQYKFGNFTMNSIGITGIEDKDGNPVKIQGWQDFLENGMAIELIPTYKYKVAANSSKDFDLQFDSKSVISGEYSSAIVINNNTAENPIVELPVSMKVQGDGKIEPSEDVFDLGELMTYQRNTVWVTHYKMISFRNTGSGLVEISSMYFDDDSKYKLQHYVYNEFFWRWEWQDVPPTFNEPLQLFPNESAEFRIAFTPDAVDGNEVVSNIVINSNIDNEFKVKVTSLPVLPPAAEIDDSAISILSLGGDSEQKVSIAIDNSKGEAALTYDASLEYTREDLINESTFALTANNNARLSFVKFDKDGISAKAQTNEAFANILAHDDKDFPDTAMGLGEGSQLVVGTRFTGLETGFNLSEISTWYIPYKVLRGRVKAHVLIGKDIASAKTVSSTEYHYEIDEEDSRGGFIDIKLDDVVKIYPYETFFIVLEYPLGASHPQGVAYIEKRKDNTFLFPSDNTWLDMASSGFPEVAWMVRAKEKTVGESNWVNILTPSKGEVLKGESLDFNINIVGSRAIDIDSYASLTINTNDPENQRFTIPMHVRKNQGPLVGERDNHDFSVNEGEVLEIINDVKDPEGHSIKSVKLASEYKFVEHSFADGKSIFKYTPDFDSEGKHSFDLIAIDEHGETSTTTYTVDVWNVNRAPIAKEVAHQDLTVDNPQIKLLFSDMIEDPDGEKLTYTYTVSVDGILEIFTSEEHFLITPAKAGTVAVTVTGTDSEGAKASTTFNVNVSAALSNDDMLVNRWSIYPNPVVEIMNLYLGDLNKEDIIVNIYNTVGTLVISEDVSRGTKEAKINMSRLSSGMYIVKIQTELGETTKEILVK